MPNKLLEKGKASLCISLPGVTMLNIAKIEGKVLHGTAYSSSPVLTSVTPASDVFISSSTLPAFLCNFPAFLPLSPGKKTYSTNANTTQDRDLWSSPAAGEV